MKKLLKNKDKVKGKIRKEGRVLLFVPFLLSRVRPHCIVVTVRSQCIVVVGVIWPVTLK